MKNKRQIKSILNQKNISYMKLINKLFFKKSKTNKKIVGGKRKKTNTYKKF